MGKECVEAGRSKWRLAAAAAAAGHDLVIVDDGFSHWALARDLDIVLLDTIDPWAGGLLPLGRAREPRRALQRADWIVMSHAGDAAHARETASAVAPWAPAARFAAGRHALSGVHGLDGRPSPRGGPARLVTATGNPAAVERTALEAGFWPVVTSRYRDHHWLSRGEAGREYAAAKAAGATLLLTLKDSVRWPLVEVEVAVLEVRWEWLFGGEELVTDMLASGSEA